MHVVYNCFYHDFTAMGIIANHIIEELTNAGITVSFNVFNKNELDIDKCTHAVRKAILTEYDPMDCVGIQFTYPDMYKEYLNYRVNIGYTGADSYGTPRGWYLTGNPTLPQDSCNNFCHYMLTPSDYSRKIMKSCGVTTPIELYPHGIDPLIFTPQKRTLSKPFTIALTGELTKRKGVPDLIAAFIDVVGSENEDFQLLLRANTHMTYLHSDLIKDMAAKTKNIKIEWKDAGQSDIVSYMHNAHIFAWPSLADWAGMTPLEACATGAVVLATDSNGYFEFIGDKIISIKSSKQPVGNQHPYLLGDWNQPDPYDIRYKLIDIINNYEKYSDIAYENAFKIHEEFSWKAVTKKYLLPFLDKIDRIHFKNISGIDIISDRIRNLRRIPSILDKI